MTPRIVGTGTIKRVTSADPAAGAEVSLTVPQGKVWRWIAGMATLVTSAVAANRFAHAVVDDGGGSPVWDGSPVGAHAANTTVKYGFAAGGPAGPVDGVSRLSMPFADLYLESGWRIRSLTTALDVGDNWSALEAWVEEW